MLRNSSFGSRNNVVNKNKRFSQGVKKINILNARSIDIEDEYFTNYTTSYIDKLNQRFFEIYDNVIVKGKNIEYYCEGEELRGNGLNTRRLLNILNSYPGINENNSTLPNIIKYKNRQKDLRGLQFYLKENKITGNIDIILIDLYHLGLPSQRQSLRNGSTIYSHPKVQYNKLHKKKKYCMSDLIESHINGTKDKKVLPITGKKF